MAKKNNKSRKLPWAFPSVSMPWRAAPVAISVPLWLSGVLALPRRRPPSMWFGGTYWGVVTRAPWARRWGYVTPTVGRRRTRLSDRERG
ncbi:MAG: hypothetical protein JSR77_13365 [Planctomycetes bacterium]|nr:hypothetical protein [Planctomycetota bacterium]